MTDKEYNLRKAKEYIEFLYSIGVIDTKTFAMILNNIFEKQESKE